MKQKYTILFDLDGTLVDTAPDLIRAHNHVMKKFGYPTRTNDEKTERITRLHKKICKKERDISNVQRNVKSLE